MPRQDQPPPFDKRGFRVRNASVDLDDIMRTWPMRPQRPATGVADQRARYDGGSQDTAILRDNTPWIPTQHYIPAARGVASWAAYPARPALCQRDVTYNRRGGTTQTRYLQNPNAPGTGLHTQQTGVKHSAVTVERYAEQDIGRMKNRRQNRLSPAIYNGQSFSQTTDLQGGGNIR